MRKADTEGKKKRKMQKGQVLHTQIEDVQIGRDRKRENVILMRESEIKKKGTRGGKREKNESEREKVGRDVGCGGKR